MRAHTFTLTDSQWTGLFFALLGEAETLCNSPDKEQRKEGRTLCLIINKLRAYKNNTNQ
jgi:hypothetical protein